MREHNESVTSQYRFYGDLAPWWPLLSPPEEYTEEAAFIGTLLGSVDGRVPYVLELGSGGGHNAVYLKRGRNLTLVDIAEPMLAVSRKLNPECEHVLGDLRTIRLEQRFDAVLIHDAIEYMTTEPDLALALATAFVHCKPGGTAVFVPDRTRETYTPSTDCGGIDGAAGRNARYLAWDWDPDPGDDWTQTDYAFLLRETDGSVQVAHESHRLGLFPRSTWLRLMAEAGFRPQVVLEETTEDRAPREIFVGTTPL